jgi:hypothetical protein
MEFLESLQVESDKMLDDTEATVSETRCGAASWGGWAAGLGWAGLPKLLLKPPSLDWTRNVRLPGWQFLGKMVSLSSFLTRNDFLGHVYVSFLHTYVYTHTDRQTYVYTHMHTHAHTHIRIYIYIERCVYVYACIMMIIDKKRTMIVVAICSSRNDIPIYSICIYTLMYLYDVHV